MLPDAVLPVPASLMTLLAVFSPLFTAPSLRTFTGLACGFLAQSGKRTVCGMLAGAGLSRLWPHDRAHYFFCRARWNPDDLGIAAAKLVIALLVPGGEPVEALIEAPCSAGGGNACGHRRGFMTAQQPDLRKQATGTTGSCSPSGSGCPWSPVPWRFP